jgi:putative component of toxin-antitoxin plasmid stabilization module
MVEIELRAEVADWLSGLSAADQKRAKHAIDRLASLGHMARMPFSRSLGDGLFELRFSLGPTARRITYRFTTDNRIVLLTTFRKQRNNERTEIERARQVAKLDQEEEHGG